MPGIRRYRLVHVTERETGKGMDEDGLGLSIHRYPTCYVHANKSVMIIVPEFVVVGTQYGNS